MNNNNTDPTPGPSPTREGSGCATIRTRVWERGSGVTMACGTGACASTAAAVSLGYCMPDTPITVRLDGGALEVTVAPDGKVTMTGPATFVYEGETIGC